MKKLTIVNCHKSADLACPLPFCGSWLPAAADFNWLLLILILQEEFKKYFLKVQTLKNCFKLNKSVISYCQFIILNFQPLIIIK